MLQLQSNIRVGGLKPEALLALYITDQVFIANGQPTVAKSIVDGDHAGGRFATSSHFSGTAFDVTVKPAVADKIVAQLIQQLGVEYFVTLNTAKGHIHVSYIPKQP